MSLGSKETMAYNIKKYLIIKGIDQTELSKALGLSESTCSSWVNAINYPRIDKIEMMANYFGVEKSDLIEDKSGVTVLKSVLIPVLGRVQAGIPVEAIENIIDYEEITQEVASKGQHFGLKIRGNSMEPRIAEGDVVIVRRQPDVDSGQIGIVMVDGTDATVKRVVKHKDGITLIAFNPVYPPKFFTNMEIEQLPVEIIGRVVELRGKF